MAHYASPHTALYGMLSRPLGGHMAPTPLAVLNTTQHKPTPVRWARHLDKPEHGDTRHVHMTTSHVDTCVGRQLWCWGFSHTIEHPPPPIYTKNAYIYAAIGRDRPSNPFAEHVAICRHPSSIATSRTNCDDAVRVARTHRTL